MAMDLTDIHRLLDAGFAIFPLQPRAKIPYGGTHGCKDATRDRETVEAWHRDRPLSNWGIATGPEGGVIALDLDSEEARDWMRDLCNAQGIDQSGWIVSQTARGEHILFRYPEGVDLRNSVCKIAPGLDIRATGGYVVAPPSVHPSGALYVWKSPPTPAGPPPIPNDILALLTEDDEPEFDAPALAVPRPESEAVGPNYAAHIVNEAISACRSGIGRHDALKTAAVKLRDARLDPHEIHASLVSIAGAVSGLKDHPVTDKEVGDIVRWLGTTTPRNLPPPGKNYKPKAAPTVEPAPATQTDIRPIDTGRQSSPPLPPSVLEALPTCVREFVEEAALATETPPAMGIMALLTCSSLMTLQRLKERTGGLPEQWATVWSLASAPVGMGKSHILSHYLRPYIDHAEPREHEAAAEAYKLALARWTVFDRERARLEKKGTVEDLVALEEPGCPRPVEPRDAYLTQGTPEAIAEVAVANGGRFALISAEGECLQQMTGMYSAKRALTMPEIVINSFDGGTVKVARVSKGATRSIQCALSTCCIFAQPAVMRKLRQSEGFAESGFASRFLCGVFHHRADGRSMADIRDIDPAIASRFSRWMEDAYSQATGHTRANYYLAEPDEDAARVLIAYADEMTREARVGKAAHLADMIIRQPRIAQRIAALLHWLRWPLGEAGHPYGEEVARAAVALARWGEAGAQTLAYYDDAPVVNRYAVEAQIKSRGGKMSLAQLIEAHPTLPAEQVEVAIADLIALRRLVESAEPYNGRTVKMYAVRRELMR